MDNMELYNKLRAVPEEAKKPIEAGRLKGFTDINPMWRIKALTEAFGACGFGWWYKITDKRIECFDNEYRAFVDIELYYKWNDETSQPVVGTGGSSFVTIENSGKPYVSDECFKMALTDAISVAAKALGVGADVYYQKDRTKYTAVNKEDPKKAETKSETKPQQAATTPATGKPTCDVCGAEISNDEYKFSMRFFNRPLCRQHQPKR